MARRSVISIRQVMFASLAFGTAMVVIAPMPDLWASYPAAFAIGITSIAFMTTSTAVIQFRAAPEMRGRVLALQTMVFLGSTPIGGPLLGALIDLTDARVGMVVGGVAALAAGLYGLGAIRRSGGAWSHDTRVRRDAEVPLQALVEDATSDVDGDPVGAVAVVSGR